MGRTLSEARQWNALLIEWSHVRDGQEPAIITNGIWCRTKSPP